MAALFKSSKKRASEGLLEAEVSINVARVSMKKSFQTNHETTLDTPRNVRAWRDWRDQPRKLHISVYAHASKENADATETYTSVGVRIKV